MNDEKKRDSFIFYRSFIEAINMMPPKEYKEAMQAIAAYALDDVEPTNLGRYAQMAFALIKPQLDANTKRFENGCKGGRPKTKTEPKENQNETKTEPNGTEAEPNYNVNYNYNHNPNLNDNLNNRARKPKANYSGSKISPFCSTGESTYYDLKELEKALTQ